VPLRTLVTRSEAETQEAGRALAAELRGGDVVLLRGNLGMGKTVFARGVVAGLGIDPGRVHSPTFTLVNHYGGRPAVYHVDLYRIGAPSELDELGLEEVLGGGGIALVEWPERLGPYRPERCLEVVITDRGGNERGLALDDRREVYSSR
jgi:tRNA threonylcarbamoyladenosine biosynthesis protein TsaE